MAVAGALEIDVVLNGRKVQKGIDKIKKRVGVFEKDANKIFGKLAKFASYGFIAKKVVDITNLGRSMSMLADRTGLATDKLDGLRTAFSAMGGSASSIDRLIGSISKGLAGLSMGKGEYASRLASMGISAWGSNGKVKDPNQVMGDIADWTRNQLAMGRTNAEVAAFLEDAFGIDYQTFKLLALGRGGMAHQEKIMKEKTGVVSSAQIRSLNQLFKSFAVLKTTLSSFSQQIVGDLAPAFTIFVDLLQGLFRKLQPIWNGLVKFYKDLIGDGEELNTLLNGLKSAVDGLVTVFKYLVEGIKIGLTGVKMFGQALGTVWAWIEDKFGWMISSPRDKDIHLAAVHAREALDRSFSSPEERLKWLADKGTHHWRQAYENYKLGKELQYEDGSPVNLNNLPFMEDELVWENGKPVNLDEVPLIGDEVIKAKMAEPNPIYVNVENNLTENGDDSYDVETITNVSQLNGSFQQKSFGKITGE